MKYCAILIILISPLLYGNEVALKLNDNDWPPFFFGGEYNKSASEGIGKEILDICIPPTGYKHEYTFYPIKRMRKYMEEGKLDINVYSHRPSRESFLIYGKEPIFSASYRPVVRKGSDININSIRDFENYHLGHLLGLRYSPEFYEYVMLRQKQKRLATTTRSSYVLKMLTNQQIDIFVGITQSARWYAKQQGVSDKIMILDFDIKTSDYFVSLSRKSDRVKNKKQFLSQIDNCIKQLKESGDYQKISQRYQF